MSDFPPVFAGSRFAVVGLGRSGSAAARALKAMGADVIAWDDSPAARAAAAGLRVCDPTVADEAVSALVLSPGIAHRLPAPHAAALWAAARSIPILSDAELLFSAVRRAGSRARFIGVTGTNGKSTTTALIAHVLRLSGRTVAAGANLGPASLSLPLLPDDGVYVLEMSSYLLERLATLRFAAAVMLNLSPDHFDRHGDMAGYAAAKRAIFDRQGEGDVAVVGIDDAPSRALAAEIAKRPVPLVRVSAHSPADVWCEQGVLRDDKGPILPMSAAAALPGAHNAQNAAAAAALALALGVPRADLARAIASFPGLAHRQERVVEIDGVLFVNDSKATNADAAARALACYPRLVWIAGGIAKAGGITALAPFFPRLAEAILIGRDAAVLAATLAEHGISHRLAGRLEVAVPMAFAAAQRSQAKVVLLSPACASFDQFSGFEARGEAFVALVGALARSRWGAA